MRNIGSGREECDMEHARDHEAWMEKMTGDLDGYASVVWHEMLPVSVLTLLVSCYTVA